MKRILAVAVALAPLVVADAAAADGTLYVQQAERAALVRSDGGWKLVLKACDAHVIAFGDGPAGTGRAIRVGTFVRDWALSFGGDPPNAALQIEGAPASRDVALLELSRPRLSAHGRQLTYRAVPLTATSTPLGGLARRADRGVWGHFGRVTVFIDDGSARTTPPSAS